MPRAYDIVLSELIELSPDELDWLTANVGGLLPPIPRWFSDLYPVRRVVRITSWDGRFIRFISRELTEKERKQLEEQDGQSGPD